MCKFPRDYSTGTQVSRIAFILVFVIVVTMYNYAIITTSVGRTAFDLSRSDSYMNVRPPAGYLVWNDQCQMQDVSSVTSDVLTQYNSKNYTLCSNESHLTEVFFDLNSRNYMLHINDLAKRKWEGDDDEVSCCYQSVLHPQSGSSNSEYELEDCVPFDQDYVLPPNVESVIISCKSFKMKKEIQKDAYCFVAEKLEVREKMQAYQNRANSKRPVSLLILGIDGVSRFNLRRTMPETISHLLRNYWFELSGYNKIDDNPFPNLMALLSGYNMTTVSARCKPGIHDKCNFIWDLFRQNGYVTGYAEDEIRLSAFNNLFQGLEKPPFDYYQKPFMLAVENSLEIQKQNDMTVCIGLRHTAEYIYDYALELATRYKSEPYFGLFMANTFSHNAFRDPSAMDIRIAKYLEEMKQRGILDDSIVIFFSDHTSRLENVSNLRQGFLDERLPFIFIWLPHWFRAKHPEFVKALSINRYRLTNPYDMHMTLKHILELSGRTGKLPGAEGCPNCQSLLVPVSPNRSCKDIAIEEQWCACNQYENVPTRNPQVVKAVEVVVLNINEYLRSVKLMPPCYFLKLRSIDNAQRKVKWKDLNVSDGETYRVRFTVNPAKASFEVTIVESNAGTAYEVIGGVRRLDAYKATSSCINHKKAKKYCICNIRFLVNRALNRYRRIDFN